MALLAPEAPDAAALLYKVSTAALTVAAAYGWPGEQMLCPACGVVLGGKSAAGGGAAPARGPDQQRLHLSAPLAGGTAGGRGRCGAGCAGVLRFLGRGGGQVFPARLTVADTALDVRAFCDTGFSVQEPLSGRTVVLVRFGAVQSRLPPALGTYLEQHFAGAAPCLSRRWGCALFPAPPWPGTVSCRPSRPACAAPAPPAGQGMAEHLYAAFADLPAA